MLVVILLQIHEDQKPLNDIVHGQPHTPPSPPVCDEPDTPPSPPVCDVDEPRNTHQVNQPPPGPSHEARSRACFSLGQIGRSLNIYGCGNKYEIMLRPVVKRTLELLQCLSS
ncbi:hypothetical protein N9L19_00580 [bacterium]|nr:hypothetical protein [bacterium]